MTLPSFTVDELSQAQELLAARVASMMGRKMEEGDWSHVYCEAKGIPDTGWSNLNIDVAHGDLGVEHKMLCVKSSRPIREYCGTTLMHPAATRSIRIPSTDGDPTEVARDVLTQYGKLIEQRRHWVAKKTGSDDVDLRTGWLLWQVELVEFLYWEERMLPPDPNAYTAEWRDSGGGSRRRSKNLWVYEKSTGKKRYSITTAAGPKIQPYFDVPPPNDQNLCFLQVQGEVLPSGSVRIWVTSMTAISIRNVLGSLALDDLNKAISDAHDLHRAGKLEVLLSDETAVALELSRLAYKQLVEALPGVSDEHRMQQLVHYLVTDGKKD